MALQERDFFHEQTEVKPARYTCSHCRHRFEIPSHQSVVLL